MIRTFYKCFIIIMFYYYCRPNAFSSLFRQILLSEIAQIASLGCKTHIYKFWEGWRNYKEGKGKGEFCAQVYGKVALM